MALSSEQQTENKTAAQGANPASVAKAQLRPLTLADAVSSISSSEKTFEDDVRELANALGGEYLFGLPASGLVKDCQRIAAINLPRETDGGIFTEFVLLEKDGETMRLRKESDSIKELDRFAQTFVDVLGKIGPLASKAGTEGKPAN